MSAGLDARATTDPPPAHDAEHAALTRVIDRLREQFPELSPDQIERAVRGEADRFDGRPVRDFVPILVERSARDGLIVQHRHRA